MKATNPPVPCPALAMQHRLQLRRTRGLNAGSAAAASGSPSAVFYIADGNPALKDAAVDLRCPDGGAATRDVKSNAWGRLLE
jgi:hypothetical protein